MEERLLHYVWRYKMFDVNDLRTAHGERVEVIDVGLPNSDAGADMFNAKIRIGETLWVGNVEIHVRASDWNKHGHHRNAAYNNVVLHVVYESDCEVFQSNGQLIPQIELKFSDEIVKKYNNLQLPNHWIPCEREIADVQSFVKTSWMETLLSERLMRKTEDIESLLEQSVNNWEEVFYVFLARNFGFGTNADVFMRLAKSLPLSCLAKHRDSIFQLEALLFGQSGLLEMEKSVDEYTKKLESEYRFLRHKYGLTMLDGSVWKMFRLRPMNFPHVRIAQFAALVHDSSKLFSKLLEERTVDQLSFLFETEVSDYWLTHYRFVEKSRRCTKKLTRSSISLLLINTVAPFLFAYGKMHGEERFCERAVGLLEQLPPEKNGIVSHFSALGMECRSAYETQALIQLKTVYCDGKKCLRCRIGHDVLKHSLRKIKDNAKNTLD